MRIISAQMQKYKPSNTKLDWLKVLIVKTLEVAGVKDFENHFNLQGLIASQEYQTKPKLCLLWQILK